MRFSKFLALICLYVQPLYAQISIQNLRCEQDQNPLGVESFTPHLSWQLISAQRNQRQTAFRVLVADSPDKLNAGQGNMWDSGKRTSDQSIQVEFEGSRLKPAQQYFWKVMVWDKSGISSAWSPVAFWRMGLPGQADWVDAKWIGLEKMQATGRIVPGVDSYVDIAGQPSPASNLLPQFRKEILIRKKLKSATAFISGLGQFELFLNGAKVGDHVLDPGWTQYDKVAQYATFDLTDQIKSGANAFGVMLGNGFFNIPNQRYKKLVVSYGYPMFIARIQLEYADGSSENLVSDLSWKATPSPITFSSVFGGEDYNALREEPGWMKPGFNDKAWQTPVVVQGPPRLSAQFQDPIKVHEIFTAGRPSNPQKGIWLYDLGQNMSGFPELTVTGQRGDSVKITPSELLSKSNLADQQAVGAPVYFAYTLRGSGRDGQPAETWHPQFTYYGFRYIQIEGAVPYGEPNPDHLPVVKRINGLHTHSAARRVGAFSSSSRLFNKIDTLIDWSIRSNMASVLTDCPHREKLGWLEVAHLMGSSMHYEYDVARYFTKIIHDMQQSQTDEGLIPSVAPEYPRFPGAFRDSPEWGSASVILPWYVYKWYGDKRLLSENYSMMKKYMDYLAGKSKDNILMHGLGDWYDLGPKDPGSSQLTPQGITATAMYYYDLSIMSKVALILGNPGEVVAYEQQAVGVKKAFNEKFFNQKLMYYGTNSQTANAMALYMDLVEPLHREAVLSNLISSIKANGNSLTAGDVGFRYLLQALGQAAEGDIIFDMNSRSDVPGYGYQLAKGATALTESWHANTNASNNHMMLGHLMEWFYNGLSGIQDSPESVASKEVVIRPQFVGDITSVNTHYNSPYGRIGIQWKKAVNHLTMTIEVPVNTTALVYIPTQAKSTVTESGKPVSSKSGIQFIKREAGCEVFRVGSGKYSFQTIQ